MSVGIRQCGDRTIILALGGVTSAVIRMRDMKNAMAKKERGSKFKESMSMK